MSAVGSGSEATFIQTRPEAFARALASSGLWLDLGAATVHVRSPSAQLAAQLQCVYAAFPFRASWDWADVHVSIDRVRGPRRWLRPQVCFRCDSQQPFEPFPASAPLPLFEWGCNWMLAQRRNDLLLLHSAALERDGFALVLPAMPGSGKSTLAAALSLRGWRLLSDEFGALDPEAHEFGAVLKPVALKNASIDVIRRLEPEARMGPAFPNTRKGTLAHLAALPDAVARRHQGARARVIVLPLWQQDAPTCFEAVPPDRLFSALAFNAFNYKLLGETGFRCVAKLVRECEGWHLVYSDLEGAIAAIERLWERGLRASVDGVGG